MQSYVTNLTQPAMLPGVATGLSSTITNLPTQAAADNVNNELTALSQPSGYGAGGTYAGTAGAGNRNTLSTDLTNLHNSLALVPDLAQLSYSMGNVSALVR